MATRRWKPSNAQREATHEATAGDYAKLAQAVVEAIILKQRDVILKLPYFVVMDKTFPKGVLVSKDEQFNYYRAKAFKLADWLYERNYLPDDAKGIVRSRRDVMFLEGEVRKLLTEPIESLYNVDLDVEEGNDD